MVALMVLLAALAAAFDQVAKVPVLTHPLSGNDGNGGTGGSDTPDQGSGGITVPDSIGGNDSGPLLQLVGATGTSYLKLMAYQVSQDGTWTPVTGATQDLGAGNTTVGIPLATELMSNRSTLVRLLRDVVGPMPTFESTYRVCDPGGDLVYDPASGMVISRSTGQPFYELLHQQPNAANLSALARLTCSSTSDLELPPQLAERLAELSDLIAGDLDSAFAKAMELARFLASNCQLTGEDNGTISDFLFGDRSGDSKDFATAYALLLRAQGISARPCLAFRIDPNLQSQFVSPHSLAYAVEVNFDQLGWVMLNPTSVNSAGTLQEDDGAAPLNPIFPDEPLNLTGVYGLVFEDGNSDGIMQPDEDLLEGVGVQLMSADGDLLQTTETSAVGLYLFTGIAAGTYRIHLLIPEDCVITTANDQQFSYIAGLQHAADFGIRHKQPQNGRMSTVTQITASSSEIWKDANFTVEGTCVGVPRPGVTEPIEEGTVLIFLADSKEAGASRYCCGEGSLVNGHFTALCRPPTGMPAGNYQLIACYLGDDEHKPSDSDPSVRVLDDTVLRLEIPQPTVAGTSASINATLQEAVSGDGVSGMTVAFDIIAPWGHTTLSATTNANGTAHITYWLSSTGAVWVSAAFAGTAVLNASSDAQEFVSLAPTLILDGGVLVRGHSCTLYGRVMAGNMPLEGVTVNISSDLGTAQARTAGQGIFGFSLTPSADAILGAHTFSFRVLQESLDLAVGVVSETRLVLTYANDTISLSLLDDHGAALQGMDLAVTCGGKNATVCTGTGACEYRPEASGNHTVYFAGNGQYASAIGFVNVQAPAAAFPWYILLIVLVGIAIVILALLLLRRRSQPVRAEPRRPEVPRGPYQIGFPQIMHPLPAVWGAGEPLKIAVQGRPGVVRLRVDGNDGEDLDLSHGAAYSTRTLGLGAHRIDVEGPDGSGHADIRIVDYREEVVVLYSGAFDALRERGKVGASMTPREALGTLTRNGTLPKQSAEEMVSTFEFAEFSLRPIDRADYERMYRAVAEASS
jgi:transglutaminase-like putative cysteine protease